MAHRLIKSIATWSIARGLKLPESAIDRYVELTYLKQLLEMLDVNCVLDVGANQGQFAQELRAIGYSGWIVSFEPVGHIFGILAERFAKDQKWKGLQLALGREDTFAEIYVHELSVMSSILKSIRDEHTTRKESIPVRRLDGVLPGIVEQISEPRFFLKMDTQGFDLEVFSGAQNSLKHIVGMQSELSVQPLYEDMPHYTQVLNAYEEAGFELFNLSVVNRIQSGGLLEVNAFFLNRIGH